MSKMTKTENVATNRAKLWQMGLFALNNTATNLYMILMMYVSYYAVGIVGLGVVLVGSILTLMRVWDGVTDPLIGYIVDKTNGKFGKNRPFMLVGNIVLAVSSLIIFNVTHTLPDGMRLVFFVLMYMVYIIGYTLQCVVTKSAQSCLTNDPKQRPLFAIFDGVYNTVLFAVLTYMITNVWVKQYGGFTLELFSTFITVVIVSSIVFTALAILGIWQKDRTEFFGTGVAQKIGFKDYWDVLKNNRAIQMLVVAASTDKLAFQISGNAVISVMLYGIICGNYGFSGQLNMILMVPNFLLMLFGVGVVARKLGQRKALLWGSIGGIVFTALTMVLFFVLDPKTLSMSEIGAFTILYLLFTILGKGSAGVAGSIVIPMTADCADYEVYRSGKYVPGLMGTLFSFVDKLVSSLSNLLVSVSIAAIGFTTAQPTVETPYTNAIFYVTMFLFFIVPMIGLGCNIIAMKFYPLTKEKMAEIQNEIAAIKQKALAENESKKPVLSKV